MIINFARRAHDHNWELDPITRSLLDTDFYKLLMLQFIWKNFPQNARHLHAHQSHHFRCASATSSSVAQLREQLEATRQLRFRKSELIWLAGNTFYGRRGIFEPAFLDWLEHDFRLSEFELSVQDGQIQLQLPRPVDRQHPCGRSMRSPAIGELKTRASLKRLSELELDILYARAKTRLWEKMERLRGVPDLSISDFGTRRRHSFLWHEYVVNAMRDTLGTDFSGTSNTYLAYKHDLEAIGTNAHELPMAMAALADNDDELQYRAIPLARTMAAELPGRVAHSAARHLRHHAVPARRARLGGRLDRPAHRQQRCLCRRRRIHRLARAAAAATRARSASSPPTPSTSSRFSAFTPTSPERSRNGASPEDFPIRSRLSRRRPLDPRTPHPLQRRLGHAAHQRFSRLQSAAATTASTP